MKLYVGTYGKYNEGSIVGEWVNLDDFSCKEDFIAECMKIHSDEHDPELMFQDYDGEEWERVFYDESYISEDYWDIVEEKNDSDFEYIIGYMDQHGYNMTYSDFKSCKDRFEGVYASPEDWAEEITEETTNIPDNLRNYIDYKAMARDEELGGYRDFISIESSDYVGVFYNC